MRKFTRFFSLILPLLLFGIFIFYSCTNGPNNPADEKTISGVLVDEQNHPVPYAIIDVYSTTTAISSDIAKDTSDEDGNYLIANLPDDISKLQVRITHQDFKTYEDNLSNFKSKSKSPVILCHDDTCQGVINIFTWNKSDSTALSDVEIRMFRSGTLIRKALTENGKLTFTNVCPGKYIVRLYKPGFRLMYDSIDVNSADTMSFHFFMTQVDSCCHGLIGVTVKDSASGNIIEGANVIVWNGSIQIGSKNTDNNGFVQFTDICEGDYVVRIAKDGYNLLYINPLHMKCNDTNISTQYLVKKIAPDTCCTAVIEATVIDSLDSSPIEGATVYIFKTGGQTIQGTTDKDGKFTATNLCAPATYTVKASKDGYLYKYVNVSYTACETKSVQIAIIKKADADSCCHGKFEVTVKDSANGDVLPSTLVHLYLGSTKAGTGYTDNNGYISFSNICPGDYTLRMQKDLYNLKYVNIHMNCNDTNISTQYLSKKVVPDTCCTAVIDVTVLDSADNTPIEGATVYIFKSGGQTIQGTTDADGKFTATNLCAPASYTVKAMKDGYTFQYVPVSFTVCETKNLTIKINKK
jgi:hypothetical protein